VKKSRIASFLLSLFIIGCSSDRNPHKKFGLASDEKMFLTFFSEVKEVCFEKSQHEKEILRKGDGEWELAGSFLAQELPSEVFKNLSESDQKFFRNSHFYYNLNGDAWISIMSNKRFLIYDEGEVSGHRNSILLDNGAKVIFSLSNTRPSP